jgi:preprotein translocase subunit SecG
MMIETMMNVLLVAVPLALAAAGIGAVLLRLGRTGDLNR